MQSGNIRRGMLALFAVAWLMPWAASAGITITPAAPTIRDSVQIGVTWSLPSPCHDGTYAYSVVANRIRIDLTTVAPPGRVCALMVVNRTVTVPVGLMAAGHYIVEVHNRLIPSPSQLLFTASFDVTGSDVVIVPLDGQVVNLLVKPLPPSNYAVELRTSWMMPSSCFASSGSTSITGNSIRADVRLVATGMTCTALPTLFDFRGALGELPPGKYNVATYFNGVPGDRRDLTIMPDLTLTNPMLSMTPSVPSSADDISVLVSATLPSSCYEVAGSFQNITGSEIRLDLTLVGTHAGCVDQPLSHSAQYFLGKMAPGTYVVRMYYNGVLGLTQNLVIKPNADLALSQTVTPNPVERTGFVLHSIDVVNSGPDAAGGVVVRTFLPPNLTYVTRSASQGLCSRFIGREIRCTLGSLGSGATAKIGILTRARIAGVATVSATVTSDAVDPNSVNNTATTDLLIRQ